MRAVVTRVKQARVEIGGAVNGQIGQGFLVLLGVGPEDTPATADNASESTDATDATDTEENDL